MTIFSAKNYCGDFDNDAAVMNVDQDLMCKFITFKGDAKKALAKKKIEKKKAAPVAAKKAASGGALVVEIERCSS